MNASSRPQIGHPEEEKIRKSTIDHNRGSDWRRSWSAFVEFLDMASTLALVNVTRGRFSNYYPTRVGQENLVGFLATIGLVLWILLAILGLGLGAGGLVQKGRSRRAALLGLALSAIPVAVLIFFGIVHAVAR
jgi:hypothetical protein